MSPLLLNTRMCVFLKSKGSLLEPTIITILILSYCKSYSNFANCPGVYFTAKDLPG